MIVLSTGSPTDWKVENSPGSISGVNRGRKHRLGTGVPHKVTGSDLGKKALLATSRDVTSQKGGWLLRENENNSLHISLVFKSC